jgi:hypothetical protein
MALTTLNAAEPTVIDGDDFVVAADDSKTTELLTTATEYAANLAAAGRDHSVDGTPAS